MSKLQKTLLTASVALLGLNGCGGDEGVDGPAEAVVAQGVVAQAAPGCLASDVDTDGDGVCDKVEAQYGTNPQSTDTDGDRLSDYAELFGSGGVNLPALGANARRKDIFIEADYYANRKPTQGALNRIITAFANAPVSNPDGSTGINLHILLDQQIATADADPDLNPVWTDFDIIKAKYFAAARAPFFHYMLFANTYSGGTSSGISRGIPAHDFIVTLGGWSTPGGTEAQQAGTLMHELGHNIGLRHGGTDNANYKPNYLSIMNYEYQVYGFTIGGAANVFDYSRVRVASFSEAAINEVAAFTPVAPTTEADLAKIGGLRFVNVQVAGNASANLDMNANGSIQTASYARDLNRDGSSATVFPASQNDWAVMVFDGGGSIGDSALGASRTLDRAEPFLVTPEKLEPCLTEDQFLAR
ncbi:hypothetical protein D7W82_05000 [Corallococcus sp. CA049B]|uniref:hypothetical protein n=1 Tax=Corallococcus sp. CA049B TaxID=2316730 RepID=UPI000EA2133C|nr:hypothetical protein [Corallococcus sp. CA049B]NOJ97271.1 hypothetical protein [Corallococcus coralloides]RKG90107.1 hypothetical protein D7W82_05000 [Corallococcus sp. CA049B]